MAETPSSPRGDLLRALIFIPLGLCLLYLTLWLVEDRLGFVSQAQAANLHLMLSQPNCTYFEQACEFEAFEFATGNPIRANAQGYVSAPQHNGLGLEIDWWEVEKTALARLRV